MLHFSLAVGFYSTAQQDTATVTQEIELITLPSMEKSLSRVKRQRVVSVASAKAATEIVVNEPVSATAAQTQFQQKAIAITGNAAHPYIRNLWKSLLNKKRDVKNYLQTRNSYLVKMKITKSGSIQDVNIQGPDLAVVEELKSSLAKEPQVRSIPDDVSKESIQVQYTVSI